jgi:hypothetical protein
MKQIKWIVLGCLALTISANATSSVASSESIKTGEINASAVSGNTKSSSLFIGLKYSNKDWPEGCQVEDGGLITDTLAVSQMTCHGERFLVFERMTHRDDKKIPHWEVIDFRVLPHLRKNEHMVDYADGCSNPSGGYTLAISKWEANKEKSFAYDISFAIRLNMEAMKLEVIEPKSVTCGYNEDRD